MSLLRWVVLPLIFLSPAILLPVRAADRPNILWLVSEDNDPFLGCYGDKNAHTPHLDKLAAEGVLYTHAFANAPVCAPSRSTLITGVYASSLGTLHMRSRYPVPPEVKFYSTYLREAGYFCMNPGKTDYNILGDDKATWNKGKSWSDAPAGKPWMLVLNYGTSHESCLHGSTVHPEFLKEPVVLPPYHPDTPEIRSNWVEYYHKITKMDSEVGAVIDKLEKDGLADDTIVFYYSDHGGILPRSKRYVYDSGLRVPMIIRFGKHFQHLAPGNPGTKIDRLVSFVDLAPSLLSLAGAAIPEQYQGQPFLGPKTAEPRDYVYGFRGRMDERYDLSYTVRDKQYRYIRNYMPHRIYGQHNDYLWKMPATVSWEKEFLAGRCNEVQSAFWREKPVEELYDEDADPFEVKNLAADAAHHDTLVRLARAMDEHLLKTRDVGLLPESDMLARAHGDPIRMMALDDSRYPVARVLKAANAAVVGGNGSVPPQVVQWLRDEDPAVRYWAAVYFCINGEKAKIAADGLLPLLKDASPCVRVAAGEALVKTGRADVGLPALVAELDAPGADTLLALNTLEALGDAAKPAAAQIAAKVKKGIDGPGRANGATGDRYTDSAAKSLLSKLRAE